MESSDESFTWSKASNASKDSDEESYEHKMTEKHIDSESEKGYKRKLHKNLFKTEDDVKQELLNEDSVKPEPDSDVPATPRKRKRKHEHTRSPDSTGHEYLDTLVKQERHSDGKPKKRKKRHTENANDSQDVSHNEFDANESLETLVKHEDHSDDKPKKRKKRHTENANDSRDVSQNEFDANESLETLVKREDHSDDKPKKHKKRHNASESQDFLQNSELDHIESQDVSQDSGLDPTDHTVKKKKSKRKKEKPDQTSEMIIEDKFEAEETIVETRPRIASTNVDIDEDVKPKDEIDQTSEMIIEDKFEAEETIVETRPRIPSTNMDIDEYVRARDEIVKKEKKKKKKRHVSENEYQEDSSARENTLDARTSFTENDSTVENHKTDKALDSPSKSKKTKKSGSKISERIQFENRNSFTEKDTSEDDTVENLNRTAVLESPSKSKNTTKRATKISDHIQFEDGEDVIAEASDNFSQQSSKMRRFLKANPHLHSIQCTTSSESIISRDDDIWLFNCPHEVDVSSLKGTDISLDNKCKIKIDNHTFIGHVENEIDRAAILTFEHNRPVIKSIELQGVVNFRKRIPKPHLFEDNIIANNQTNFIPLPDTKCRHPFFGPDYKKAMKIPSTIKSRLQNSDSENLITPKSEKKKKRKHVERDMGEDIPDGVDVSTDEQPTTRKRQHFDIDMDQPVKKKAKRNKKEKQSGETWDSEKAIEDNLFNF